MAPFYRLRVMQRKKASGGNCTLDLGISLHDTSPALCWLSYGGVIDAYASPKISYPLPNPQYGAERRIELWAMIENDDD